jgi:hypothetical protein
MFVWDPQKMNSQVTIVTFGKQSSKPIEVYIVP